MKKSKTKNNKVFIVVLFQEFELRLNDDLAVDQEKAWIVSVHSTREKAQERAAHVQRQFPEATVSVLRKTLLGRL